MIGSLVEVYFTYPNNFRQLELCIGVLTRATNELSSDSASSLVAGLIHSLVFALDDEFPQAKRAAATALSLACQSAPSQVREYTLSLTKRLITNLDHHHVSSPQTFHELG